MRVFNDLRDEHGYTGPYGLVKEYLHYARFAVKGASKSLPSKTTRPNAAPPKPGNPEIQSDPPSPFVFQLEQPSEPIQNWADGPQLRWARQKLMPEKLAQAWMLNIQQGATSVETLEEQLPESHLQDLKVLYTAAKNGTLFERNRAIAILAYFRGISSAHIASFLKISQRTVFHFLTDLRSGGMNGLLVRRPRSDKKSNDESIKSAVFALLHSPPGAHGINRTTWRLDDLHRVLKEESNVSINRDAISIIIKNAGWKWRHARVVLTSNDPEYRAKVEAIKKILSELEPNEAFFSIDEYGPFAIKQKGGVKRVAPGDQYVVPQWQKSKGYLILTAALELSRNRVTHFFSRKKNTAEMIKMADLLRDNYRGFKTIYLSWDAASWHISKDLTAHLDSLNEKAEEEGYPVIKMAPLPAGAQFLNVIESVFSGMARAIIHNSDYPSPGMAIEAIDRYFEQRNEYFATHPKKAGNKIWGKERVPSQFAEDQNCKDPAYQFPH
jgi:transposase